MGSMGASRKTRIKRTNRSPNATSSRACCGVDTTHSVMPLTTGPRSLSSTMRIFPRNVPDGFSGEANGDGVREGVASSGPSEPESKSQSFSLYISK